MLSVSLNHKVSPFQVVMKGYLKNPEGTAEAFEGGWFHTGDLGVRYPDGYIALKDRAKDIIISGGENISSVEIEAVLFSHPMILEAAVVAKADARWGETPVRLTNFFGAKKRVSFLKKSRQCAFITLREDGALSSADVIDYCRHHMAHFKAPKHVVFSDLPKTSTGKVQKHVLRELAEQ